MARHFDWDQEIETPLDLYAEQARPEAADRAEGALALTPAPAPATAPATATAGGIPGDAEMVRLVAGFCGRLAAEGVRRALHRDQWVLAYSPRGTWAGARPDTSALRVLTPPPDRFWADPFPAAIDGRTYLFFEDYPYATRKGLIAVLRGRRSRPGRRAAPGAGLPPLLSVPVPRGGELYMIPETTAVRRVELYRCLGAPDRWEYDRVLLPGVTLADVTLAEHDGLGWLFACSKAEGAHNDTEELHLFVAATALGPWRPHRGTPVKSDVGSARPAGGLYRRGESWYRPAQDCSLGYGHSIVLNRILSWDVDRYEEEEAGRLGPGWAPGVDRTHTFNVLGDLFVVDARVARPRLLPGRARGGRAR